MANDIDKTSPHYKGEFGSIYEVNQKFPSGGVEGDYVAIDGWAHYWNANRGTWCVNAQRDSYWDELITGIVEKFKLIKGATYMGVAALDSVPAKAIGAKMYYFATVAGTYKNFGGLVVPQGINVLYSENGSSWVCSTLLEVAQELGVSTRNVVSQKVVNEALAKKADKEEMNRLLVTKANTTEVNTKFTEEKERVDAELDKKFDKESVAQEFGESGNKVVSQFALPFREIESPEFIKVIVDAENHFLLGIQLDGSIEWGKGIPTPIRTKLEEIITQFRQDKTDLLESINTLNGILDKTTIKDEEGNVQDTPFRFVENEEFIIAVVDAEDRILAGIKYDGDPYFPNHGMYSVITNEEWLYAIIDAEGKLLGGFRVGDGHLIVGGKDIDTLVADIKEKNDFFSSTDNDEYLAVETDCEGRVLSSTSPDGSHYIRQIKSETIPDEFSQIDDPEERFEITTDADGKVISYRDSEGTKCEKRLKILTELSMSSEAKKTFRKELKEDNILYDDLSDEKNISIPRPKSLIKINIITHRLPSGSEDSFDGEVEVWDDSGHYFRKKITSLQIQGYSSRAFPKKNFTFDFVDCTIKIGDWVSQDSFHFKANYLDFFRGKIVAAYWLAYDVFTYNRPAYKCMPWDKSSPKADMSIGNIKSQYDFVEGARAMPDGFPIRIYHNGKFYGLYTWQLKKHRDNYAMKKDNAANIEIDGIGDLINADGSLIDWTTFEIRNPKSLICMDGSKYDGDTPKELIDSSSEKFDSSNKNHKLSESVKKNIKAFHNACSELKKSPTVDVFEKYFDVDWVIDMIIFDQVTLNIDTFSWRRNTQWGTWNAVKWFPMPYDLDQIFGCNATGDCINETVDVSSSIIGVNLYASTIIKTAFSLYKDKMDSRYKELMDGKVITVGNVIGKLQELMRIIGSEWYETEYAIWKETPSYRSPNVNAEWKFLGMPKDRESVRDFDINKTYTIGDKVKYTLIDNARVYECIKECTGIPPLGNLYSLYPVFGGYYDSIQRTASWVEQRIEFLNKYFNYK